MESVSWYVAFCEEDAQRIKCSGIISPELFRMPQQTWPYIPLQPTPGEAVRAALGGGTKTAAAAVTTITEWHILVSTVPGMPATVVPDATLWQQIGARRGIGYYRFGGELKLAEAGNHMWLVSKSQPTGLEEWANRFLRSRKFKMFGTCAECGLDPVPLWESSCFFQKQNFCMRCWHRHWSEMALDDLHSAMEARAAPEEASAPPSAPA